MESWILRRPSPPLLIRAFRSLVAGWIISTIVPSLRLSISGRNISSTSSSGPPNQDPQSCRKFRRYKATTWFSGRVTPCISALSQTLMLPSFASSSSFSKDRGGPLVGWCERRSVRFNSELNRGARSEHLEGCAELSLPAEKPFLHHAVPYHGTFF